MKKIDDMENARVIQFNVMKIDIKKFGEKNTKKFVNNIKNTMVFENKTTAVQKSENYDVVSLIYEDGTKDIFYFFNWDNTWYLETLDGNQYRNADFITDYIEHVDVTNTKTVYIQMPVAWQLELEKKTEVFDTAFFFRELVYYNINERGMTREDALVDARKSMQTNRILYQYALENDYGFTEQEMQQLLDDEIAHAKLSDNYDEIVTLYQEQGLDYETILKKRKEKIVMSKTIQKLYNAKYEEFRHGNDKIGEQVCDNLTDYWNAFVLEEVQPQMAEYDFSEFQKELDTAENDIE